MICDNIEDYCISYKDIENYDKAIADTENMWECHHRLETKCPIYKPSSDELKDWNLYYHRPASELIFMLESEHRSMHAKLGKPNEGRKWSEAYKQEMSDATKVSNIKCLETGEIHSAREWTRLGYDGARKVAKGKFKSCKGLHFQYI